MWYVNEMPMEGEANRLLRGIMPLRVFNLTIMRYYNMILFEVSNAGLPL